MITVCPGWTEQGHKNVIVLKPEDGGTPGTSHGMCPECQQALDEQVAAHERQQRPAKTDGAYEEYRRNFPNGDPRD